VYKEKHLYGPEDQILDLADRALLIKLIIDDIQISKSMPSTLKTVKEQPLQKETFISFMI